VNPVALRWLKFNFVGAIGIAVNMGVFALAYGVLGMNKLAATALAVEVAVLHNFVWHERFTWREMPRGSARDVAVRLLRFHLGNGLVSLVGGVLLMRLLAGTLHVNAYIANALSIGGCALANFAVSEWFVFRR
jgi:putative flippase GtrA